MKEQTGNNQGVSGIDLFWWDLNKNLQDPELRDTYIAVSQLDNAQQFYQPRHETLRQVTNSVLD